MRNKVMRYQEEVEYILDFLEQHGVEILGFENEDGECIDEDIAYQVTNHEMAWVKVRVVNRVRAIYFVCGNSPGEIVCDYTVGRDGEGEDGDVIEKATMSLVAHVAELEKAVETLENAGHHVTLE